MSNSNKERGDKRGVLDTRKAQKLGKTKDADAESDRADDEEEDDVEE